MSNFEQGLADLGDDFAGEGRVGAPAVSDEVVEHQHQLQREVGGEGRS